VCPVKLTDVDAKVIGDVPFPPCSMKHLRAQRDPPSVNHTICPVFNEKKTRKPLAARGGTPITQRFWRRLDGIVQIVTHLHLADLTVGAPLTEVFGLSVAPASPNAGRAKSSSHRSYAKKVLRLVDRRL
jgi:hypothetical protein